MEHAIVPRRAYVIVYVALMALLAATVAAYFVDLGPLNLALALAIAVAKVLLIILYFMHVRYGDRLTWVVAGAAFFWLAILIGLTMNDYISRGWLPTTGK
ncbi:MAG: cytochrome C oxidase subunit IV family protein [Kouleothrix sp.]|nr:cytochrome C oxidase subunit IV family protein [Kouleothrix sp.]